MSTDLFIICKIILLLCGLCFHLLGIYCLLKHKQNNNNQKVILINLSWVEITLILTTGTSEFFEWYDDPGKHEPMSKNILYFVLYWFMAAYCMAMVLTAADRLICVMLHINYTYHVTSKRLVIVATLMCVSSATLAIPFLLPNQNENHLKKYSQVFPSILSYLYVLLAIFVYVMINYKRKKRRRNLGIQSGREKNFLLQKQTLIPFCIILSFLLLVVLPQCVYLWILDRLSASAKVNIESVITVIWYTSFIADPVIYVFFNKKMRNIARDLLCCISKRKTRTECAVVKDLAVADAS
ncbi:blue-sensitive opsin-like [Hydractinia symbiolongicarpus]|uniref:blue-sensitive opsin-like n=1 Tax=Hydractinia symbiolongicarpus TaxID=13093 RepID=UPI002549CDD7|nr:blue-sensitive opsin-like [Hydractinia symbiolongicarpus]